jgi:hypothetical protein
LDRSAAMHEHKAVDININSQGLRHEAIIIPVHFSMLAASCNKIVYLYGLFTTSVKVKRFMGPTNLDVGRKEGSEGLYLKRGRCAATPDLFLFTFSATTLGRHFLYDTYNQKLRHHLGEEVEAAEQLHHQSTKSLKTFSRPDSSPPFHIIYENTRLDVDIAG